MTPFDPVALHDHVNQATKIYRTQPGVQAVWLSGSVARGWADRWSNVELGICWSELPSDAQQFACVGALGGTDRQVSPRDDELATLGEWFTVQGVKIDLMHGTPQLIDDILDAVTILSDPSVRKHAVMAGVRDSVPLYGEALIARWRDRAGRYPDELRIKMITQNLIFGPQSWLEMLAERNDLVWLSDIFVRIARALIGIALALNRTYPVSDAGKWALPDVEGLALAPAGFSARLDRLFRDRSADAVPTAGALIVEMLELVRTEAPTIEIDSIVRRVQKPRT